VDPVCRDHDAESISLLSQCFTLKNINILLEDKKDEDRKSGFVCSFIHHVMQHWLIWKKDNKIAIDFHHP